MIVSMPNGDIFTTKAQAMANAVNCYGVAGAGLALAFKQRYPEWFEDYKNRCAKDGFITTSTIYPTHPMTIFKLSIPWIINFPTKVHWKDPSENAYIEAGIIMLERLIEYEKLESVALPKLGCGLGGLHWFGRNGVRNLFTERFKTSTCTIYLYE